MADETTSEQSNGHLPVRHITELTIGERIFESTGTCYVKVTYKGEPQLLKFDIQSAGVAEVLEHHRKTVPPVPTVHKWFSGDTEEGRSRGIPRGQRKHLGVADENDPDYKKAVDEHNQQMMFAVIEQGLVVRFKDKNGDAVSGIDGLRTMGLTIGHFQEIQLAIENLTRITDEEREDFTGRRSTSAATRPTPIV